MNNTFFNLGTPANLLSTSVCHIWPQTAYFFEMRIKRDECPWIWKPLLHTHFSKDIQQLNCYTVLLCTPVTYQLIGEKNNPDYYSLLGMYVS
jgi:hypothetical protein